MLEILKFALSNFWVFVGFISILSTILYFPMFVINRILRHRNIRKWGYPPEHCDADGDFKTEKENK